MGERAFQIKERLSDERRGFIRFFNSDGNGDAHSRKQSQPFQDIHQQTFIGFDMLDPLDGVFGPELDFRVLRYIQPFKLFCACPVLLLHFIAHRIQMLGRSVQ